MKVGLRIIVILISVGIVVVAIIPPSGRDAETANSEPTPTPTSVPVQSDPGLIRDFLGGAQLDAGAKAREVLQGVDEERKEDIKSLNPE